MAILPDELKNESEGRINHINKKKVEVLAKRRPVPNYITYPEINIVRGAYIISAEGEEYDYGGRVYDGRGFLGRLVGMERHMDGYALYFTHGNEGWDEKGEKRGRPRHILHPLCIDGGFFVPEEGLRVLDNGNLVLISKYGIFRGEGYAELVDTYRSRYINMYQAYVDLKEKFEEKIGQLEALSNENQTLKASRENWLYLAGEITQRYQLLYDVYVKFRSEYEGLNALIDKLEDVDSSLKETFKYELSMIDKRVHDMLMLFENYKIDESLRADLIGVPKITDEMRNYYKNKALKKTGLGSVGQLDKELEQKEQEVEKSKGQMKQLLEQMRAMQSRIQQLEAENQQLKSQLEVESAPIEEEEIEENEESEE